MGSPAEQRCRTLVSRESAGRSSVLQSWVPPAPQQDIDFPRLVEGKVRMTEEKPAYRILQSITKYSCFLLLHDPLPHSEHPKTMSP